MGCGEQSTPEPPPEHDHPEIADPATTPSEAETEPTSAATKIFETWARNDVPAKQWREDLAPLLSAAGTESYLNTDPTRIPTLRITGEPTLREEANQVWALVTIPTNDGTFGVELTRPGPKYGWKLDAIRFPQGIH